MTIRITTPYIKLSALCEYLVLIVVKNSRTTKDTKEKYSTKFTKWILTDGHFIQIIL